MPDSELIFTYQDGRCYVPYFFLSFALLLTGSVSAEDCVTFHDSPTPVENRLFTMHLKHRMRAFQGAFHMNPDYTLWYGWNEMVQDLNEIRVMATELREKHKAK